MDLIPNWIFYLMAAVLGLELGGFATIFIQRWIDEKPILKPGRSRCPSCEEQLDLRDTIPLLSYFLVGGRCRHCDAPIGSQYMLVEISCMAWSLALAYHHGLTPEYGVHLILGVMLIAGSFIDFETFLLPDRITIGGTAIALGSSFFMESPGWQDAFLGAVAGGLSFWLIERYYTLRNRFGVGLGDVKLMCLIGALVGLSGLPLTIVLIAAASYVPLCIMAFRHGWAVFTKKLPYGPFISLGGMLYILYGEQIMQWWKAMQ